MRITIAHLQERLEREKEDKNRYYKLWQEAKAEIERDNLFKKTYSEARLDQQEGEIHRLMSIIRILAKDETLVIEANNMAKKYI